jgi:hypothetical protein
MVGDVIPLFWTQVTLISDDLDVGLFGRWMVETLGYSELHKVISDTINVCMDYYYYGDYYVVLSKYSNDKASVYLDSL